MRAYYLLPTVLAICFALDSSGQTVINTNKESQIVNKPVRLKDTTVYEIVIYEKDSFYFGTNKRMKIKENETVVLNTLIIGTKSLKIQCSGAGTSLISLSLDVLKQRIDTAGLYSLFDPTLLVRYHITKTFICDIKSVQLNNYKKIQQYTYCRRLLSKLISPAP